MEKAKVRTTLHLLFDSVVVSPVPGQDAYVIDFKREVTPKQFKLVGCLVVDGMEWELKWKERVKEWLDKIEKITRERKYPI